MLANPHQVTNNFDPKIIYNVSLMSQDENGLKMHEKSIHADFVKNMLIVHYMKNVMSNHVKRKHYLLSPSIRVI